VPTFHWLDAIARAFVANFSALKLDFLSISYDFRGWSEFWHATACTT